MNTRFAWVLAAAVLAGCSNDWSAGLGLAEDGRHQAAATAPGVASSSPVNGVRPIGFASAPDRGDLLQYPAAPVVRRTGAYTWHATRLSEEHAMAAVVSGRMRITAPDGTPIALDYARHVEHPDGNWSWIGRNPDAPGQDAVITFGPEAVFGSVPQGKDLPPLRLTMADGAGWVVSADPRQLADIRNNATHPDGPDYLVPPQQTSASAASSGMAMAGAQPQAVTASATTTVDVLVGYTNGFASARGGASAAVTRVHNLVDITNQAYTNSQVDARLRLVHSMQVSYPDATDNGTALEELTGFRAPSTPVTPDPAFNGLRAARDQYGADLVVLVRQFKDPENDGCGIAWLIGGGQSGVTQGDEFFGYSVVSDGQDQGSDGKTYFCREETFAHEVGHNMGSQHDEATAGDSFGAYAYSFGYKTGAAAGNFYTVMAYGDSGQTSYRVFSNPSVTFCGGRACGVSNQADNARSLRQTIPTIAGFRSSVVPSTGDAPLLRAMDYDGDGHSDILFDLPAERRFVVWRMRNGSRVSSTSTSFKGAYSLVDAGDLNGDGRDDAVFWEQGRRQLILATSRASGFDLYRLPYTHETNFVPIAVADINGNGRSDILLWNAATGRLTVWYMSGGTRSSSVTYNVGAQYRFVGVGDVNIDGRSDILWTNAQRNILLSVSRGTTFDHYVLGYTYGSTSEMIGFHDVSGDGRADIVFRQTDGRRLMSWSMNGRYRTGTKAASIDPAYTPVGQGAFNTDGLGDVLYFNFQNRRLRQMLSTASGFSSRTLTAVPGAGSWPMGVDSTW